VIVFLGGHEAARRARSLGKDRPDPESADGARVVPERDHAVARSGLERLPDELHEAVGGLGAVDQQPSLEEPVSGVLAVGLRDVEQLDVRGVASHVVTKQARVVVEVPFVERETHVAVHPLEGGTSLLQERDRTHAERPKPVLERVQGRRIRALGHSVVHLGEKRMERLFRQRPSGFDQVAAGSLDAADPLHPTGVQHRHRVRRPRRGEAHARPYLEHDPAGSALTELIF
jgi:hypothetical protein